MRNRWLALLASLCAASAMGAVYKWVDANGVTQYSETPPPNIEARELPIQPAPPAEATSEEAAPPSEAAPAPVGRTAQDRAREREDEQKRTGDMRQTYCAIAQRNVQVLTSGNPVVELSAEGHEMFMSPEQRAAALAEANRRVDRYCKPE